MGGGTSKKKDAAKPKGGKEDLGDMTAEELKKMTEEKMATGKFRGSAIRPSLRDESTTPNLSQMYEKMEQILHDEDELRDFSAYLMREHAEEWVQFYLEVEAYTSSFEFIDQELACFADPSAPKGENHRAPTEEELASKKAECERIFETFIKDGADRQLNLSAKAKKGVRAAVDEGHFEPRVFRQAMKCVIEQLTKERLHVFVEQQKQKKEIWIKQLQQLDKHRVSLRRINPGTEGSEKMDPNAVQSCVRLSKQVQKVISEEVAEYKKNPSFKTDPSIKEE